MPGRCVRLTSIKLVGKQAADGDGDEIGRGKNRRAAALSVDGHAASQIAIEIGAESTPPGVVLNEIQQNRRYTLLSSGSGPCESICTAISSLHFGAIGHRKIPMSLGQSSSAGDAVKRLFSPAIASSGTLPINVGIPVAASEIWISLGSISKCCRPLRLCSAIRPSRRPPRHLPGCKTRT